MKGPFARGGVKRGERTGCPTGQSTDSGEARREARREGRHWKIGDLFVEVPSNTLTDPSEFMRVGSAVFEIVKKGVVLADRIVGFRQWYVEAWGQQAIDLLATFGGDLDEEWLRAKLEWEGSLDALEPLRRLAESDEPVTREVLAGLLRDLSRRSGR